MKKLLLFLFPSLYKSILFDSFDMFNVPLSYTIYIIYNENIQNIETVCTLTEGKQKCIDALMIRTNSKNIIINKHKSVIRNLSFIISYSSNSYTIELHVDNVKWDAYI